jgi:hypothetical protein
LGELDRQPRLSSRRPARAFRRRSARGLGAVLAAKRSPGHCAVAGRDRLEAGGRRLRRGWPAGHPRRRQRCYWDELALPAWTAVVDWPAEGASLLPLTLPLPLPLWLPNE